MRWFWRCVNSKHLMNELSILVFFDSCAFGPPIESDKKAVKKLLKLEARGMFDIQITEPSQEELSKHKNMMKHRDKITSLSYCTTTQERELCENIARLLFQGRSFDELSDKDQRDVLIVFTAGKYKATYLVTCDRKHMLSKQEEIKDMTGLIIVDPQTCLDHVLKRIKTNKEYKKKARTLPHL